MRAIHLRDRANLKACVDRKLFGEAMVIDGEAQGPDRSAWVDHLYQPIGQVEVKPVKIRAIPYCLWDNRKPGAMAVWLPRV